MPAVGCTSCIRDWRSSECLLGNARRAPGEPHEDHDATEQAPADGVSTTPRRFGGGIDLLRGGSIAVGTVRCLSMRCLSRTNAMIDLHHPAIDPVRARRRYIRLRVRTPSSAASVNAPSACCPVGTRPRFGTDQSLFLGDRTMTRRTSRLTHEKETWSDRRSR